MTEDKPPATPVSIETPVPIPVTVVAGVAPSSAAPVGAPSYPGQAGALSPDKPNVMILPSGQPVAAPTTTEEQDRTSAGQRKTSDTWEETQRQIALSVVWAAVSVSGWLAVMARTESVQTAALVFLFGVANLVIGFYFGRTNHQKVGGVMQGR
jgi:hypothetical protein